MTKVVLCVDDEAEVLAALRRCLRNEPYEVITVLGAREGLARLGQGRVDLVITDQKMPGMSGTDFLYEVRRRSPRTARAILTGYETLRGSATAVKGRQGPGRRTGAQAERPQN